MPAAAPVNHLGALEHVLNRRFGGSCSSEGTDTSNMTCTLSISASDFPSQCRDKCFSTADMTNCVSEANPEGMGTVAGGPNLTNSSDPTSVNNATAQCYKTGLCPKLGEYMSCMQCLIDRAPSSSTKSEGVKLFNTGIAKFANYCNTTLNATAENYTPLSGARTTAAAAAAGSLLLVAGVAVASFL